MLCAFYRPAYLLLAVSSLGFAPHPPSDQALIVGKWVAAADSSSALVFTKTQCTRYYNGQVLEVTNYSLSNKSPQCGTKVPVESYTSYLQLTRAKPHLTLCYELTSLDDTYLAFRPVDAGGVTLFKRRK